jgi:hypothetical protein
MGYTTRPGTSIRDFWPDNDDRAFYGCYQNSPITELIEQAKSYFGDQFDMEKVIISSEYIHTDCINYDLYSPGDYTNFIVLRLVK